VPIRKSVVKHGFTSGQVIPRDGAYHDSIMCSLLYSKITPSCGSINCDPVGGTGVHIEKLLLETGVYFSPLKYRTDHVQVPVVGNAVLVGDDGTKLVVLTSNASEMMVFVPSDTTSSTNCELLESQLSPRPCGGDVQLNITCERSKTAFSSG